MSHSVTFYLGIHCLQEYPLLGCQVCKELILKLNVCHFCVIYGHSIIFCLSQHRESEFSHVVYFKLTLFKAHFKLYTYR